MEVIMAVTGLVLLVMLMAVLLTLDQPSGGLAERSVMLMLTPMLIMVMEVVLPSIQQELPTVDEPSLDIHAASAQRTPTLILATLEEMDLLITHYLAIPLLHDLA